MNTMNKGLMVLALLGMISATGCVRDGNGVRPSEGQSSNQQLVSVSDADRYAKANEGKVLKDGQWVIDLAAAQAFKKDYEKSQANSQASTNPGVTAVTRDTAVAQARLVRTSVHGGLATQLESQGHTALSFVSGQTLAFPGFVNWTGLRSAMDSRGWGNDVVFPLLRDLMAHYESYKSKNGNRDFCARVIASIQTMLECGDAAGTGRYLDLAGSGSATNPLPGGAPCDKSAPSGKAKPAE